MAEGLNRIILLSAILIVALTVLPGIESRALAFEQFSEQAGRENTKDSDLDQSVRPAFGDDFSLGACQQECRSKFGIDPYWRGGGDSSVWRLYAICIQDCNIKFWKEYDRRMDELKNLKLD
ncbi:MAG: hypothetical protein NTW27_00420 [Deltaproteobacteria bacterium]|nr:hypothetical protein [Deltaproteobacteria bacterium]